MGDFVHFCVNIKKLYLRDLVNSYNCLNTLVSLATDLNSKLVIKLPIEFLVETVYLSLLDSRYFIGNIQQITNKLLQWFSEFKWLPRPNLNSIIETILKTTPCFRRLLTSLAENGSRTSRRRPIILGKRQYIWSINLNYLNFFVKYFFKLIKMKK